MAKLLQELIDAAKTALDATDAKSEDPKKIREHEAAKARYEALKEAQSEGFVKKQDDLNALDAKKNREFEDAVKNTLGMTLKEAEAVMESVEESLAGDEGDGDGDGDESVLERFQTALEERDTRIKTLEESGTNFQRSYYERDVRDSLDAALKSRGLQDNYRAQAHRLLSYGDLVDKKMKGEEVTNEEIEKLAEDLKTETPAFFQEAPREDFPGIEDTPEGVRDPAEITDEERARLSDPVF